MEGRRGKRNRSWRGDRGKHKLGSIAELFGDPRWRRNTIVGMVLAFAGVVGLWGIGFFSFDLVAVGLPQALRGPGAERPGNRRQADFLDRDHLAASRTPARSSASRRSRESPIASAASRRSPSPSCWPRSRTACHVLVPRRFLADLRVDPDHGLLPARPLRRLRDLLPRAVSDPAAEHGHVVLLQRGPAGRRRRPSVLGLLTSRVFEGYHEPMRYAGVAMCSVFFLGLSSCPSRRRPAGSRCRSDGNRNAASLLEPLDQCLAQSVLVELRVIRPHSFPGPRTQRGHGGWRRCDQGSQTGGREAGTTLAASSPRQSATGPRADRAGWFS